MGRRPSALGGTHTVSDAQLAANRANAKTVRTRRHTPDEVASLGEVRRMFVQALCDPKIPGDERIPRRMSIAQQIVDWATDPDAAFEKKTFAFQFIASREMPITTRHMITSNMKLPSIVIREIVERDAHAPGAGGLGAGEHVGNGTAH